MFSVNFPFICTKRGNLLLNTAVADPDHQIQGGGGGHPDPEIRGGGRRSPK